MTDPYVDLEDDLHALASMAEIAARLAEDTDNQLLAFAVCDASKRAKALG